MGVYIDAQDKCVTSRVFVSKLLKERFQDPVGYACAVPRHKVTIIFGGSIHVEPYR